MTGKSIPSICLRDGGLQVCVGHWPVTPRIQHQHHLMWRWMLLVPISWTNGLADGFAWEKRHTRAPDNSPQGSGVDSHQLPRWIWAGSCFPVSILGKGGTESSPKKSAAISSLKEGDVNTASGNVVLCFCSSAQDSGAKLGQDSLWHHHRWRCRHWHGVPRSGCEPGWQLFWWSRCA